MTRLPRAATALAALCLVGFASPGWGFYKVVGPDGKITYTDRPPTSEGGKVTNVARDYGVAPPAAEGPASGVALSGLPAEVRQVAQRFPVTLYASPDCAPCDQGRRLLSERGIPFSEKRVSSEEDAEGMFKATGVRSLPVLVVGGQVVRGWGDAEWQATLDTAGYPRESRLPRGYVPPTPTTVAERKPRPAPRPAPAPVEPAADALPTPAAAPGGSGIRF